MRYGLAVTTGPATEPVSTADAKTHLRVDTSDEDSYIDALVVAARKKVEESLQRALITTQFTMYLDAFPADIIFVPNLSYHDYDPAVRLPRSPVQSVDAIKYIDTEGTQQTLAASKYRTDLKSLVPRITAAYAETWPTTRPVMNAVEIDFTAGYGDNATDVPEPIIHAIKIMISTWYDQGRSGVILNGTAQSIPMTADFLLGPYRVATQSDP